MLFRSGQVDYCAANCFLDAFAQDRGRSRRVVTIDWGPWQDVGMAARAALPSRSVDDRGMSADEGLRALDIILACAAEPQIIVSPVELSELFAHAVTVDPEHPDEQRSSGQIRPDIATEYMAPRGVAERVICDVWQDVLGIDRVGVQDSLFDLGGDSLIAIQLIGTVNKRLGSKLTLGDLYAGPTAGQLAGLVGPARDKPADVRKSPGERTENIRKRRQHQQQIGRAHV